MYPPAWGLGNAAPFPPYTGNGPFGSGNFISGPGQALPSNHPGAGIGQGGFLGGGQLPGSSNFGVAGGQPATGPSGFMQGGGAYGGGRGMGAGGQSGGMAASPPIPGSLCGGMGGLGGIPGQGGAPRQGGRGKGDGGGFLGGGKGMGGGGGRGGKGDRRGKDGGGRGRGKGGDGGKNNVSGPGGCGGCGGCMPFCGGKGGGCKPPGPPPMGGKGSGMMGRGAGGGGSGGHSNLFVGNLPENASEDMVRETFAQCGTVTSCRVLTRSGRTCALVKMENVQQAEQACKTIPSIVGGDLKSRWLVKIAETDFGSSRGGKDGFGKGCKGGFGFFKGKGKPFGWGFGYFKGKDFKGKGKGKGPQQMLRVDPSLKVWIGNLPENAEWKELQTHMNQAGKTVWVEVFAGTGKGTGAVVYSAAEEVTKAIEELNGSDFGGQALVVDAWVRQVKETPEGGEQEGAPAEGGEPKGEEL